MKLFKNAIAEMPISNCKECPNKVSQRYAKGNKFYTGFVCIAIEVIQDDPNTGEQKVMHPSIVDAMWHDFFPENCPLQDAPTPQSSADILSASKKHQDDAATLDSSADILSAGDSQ